jgi:hypothetical protein
VKTVLVSPGMLRKARLEAEEGRTLSRPEIKQLRGGRQYLTNYLTDKLRRDSRLDDRSLFPSFWNHGETFEANWLADHRRFLKLAEERTGTRYTLLESGEWGRSPVPSAPRKIMSDPDWQFYNKHFHANETLYGPIEAEIFELPPG